MTVDPNEVRIGRLREKLDQLTNEILQEQGPGAREDPALAKASRDAALRAIDDLVLFTPEEMDALGPAPSPAPASMAALDETAKSIAHRLWGDDLDLSDPPPPVPSPSEVYANVLSELAKGRHGSGDDLPDAVQESHAKPLPPELRRFLEAVGRGGPGFLGVWTPRVVLPERNFERWVEGQQREPYTERIFIEYFADLLFVGDAINGDLFYAYVGGGEAGPAEVWCYDHSQGMLTVPAQADSLETFATQAWLQAQLRTSEPSPAIEEAARALVGKSSFGFHFRDLANELLPRGHDWGAQYRERTPVQKLVERARPWMSLLAEGKIEAERLRADNRQHGGAIPSWRAIRDDVPEALYWLCRSFWLEDDTLADGVHICLDSRAPVVRTAAATFRELQEGRDVLGILKNVHGLRRELRALGVQRI